MIVQACLNGARAADFHPRLPATPDAIVADAVAAVGAGAAEIHVHVRDADGRESLAPGEVDPLIARLRAALPGTLIGISTGAWIERDDDRRLACIGGWRALPDYASVNLSEAGAPAVIERLHRVGVGVEAGIWTVADAARLAALELAPHCLRVLVEIHAGGERDAIAAADAVLAELSRHGIRKPILLHGNDPCAWSLVRVAAARRFSTRIGLEDVAAMPDGARAADNAALVRAALSIMQAAAARP
ncbi:MAG: 3-keto-5-aminohexanoate cleavage protein [Alphaproteobacteria bacterium]|nr:3-keto-5-aminohexanoate cleavage protein [Alphaproteobacteria bacterium]